MRCEPDGPLCRNLADLQGADRAYNDRPAAHRTQGRTPIPHPRDWRHSDPYPSREVGWVESSTDFDAQDAPTEPLVARWPPVERERIPGDETVVVRAVLVLSRVEFDPVQSDFKLVGVVVVMARYELIALFELALEYQDIHSLLRTRE